MPAALNVKPAGYGMLDGQGGLLLFTRFLLVNSDHRQRQGRAVVLNRRAKTSRTHIPETHRQLLPLRFCPGSDQWRYQTAEHSSGVQEQSAAISIPFVPAPQQARHATV